MNARHVLVLLYPLLATGAAQAGKEAVLANPGTLKAIATPVVQQPAVQQPVVKGPAAVAPVAPKIQAPLVKAMEPGKLEPGKLQPQIVKSDLQPVAKSLPAGKPVSIDARQAMTVKNRVDVIKPGKQDSGPMLSPLDDPRIDHKTGPRNPDAAAMERRQADRAEKERHDGSDGHSELGENNAMRLQKKMDEMQKADKAISEVQKKNSDTSSAIISNIK
jgi:hypothetical protein